MEDVNRSWRFIFMPPRDLFLADKDGRVGTPLGANLFQHAQHPGPATEDRQSLSCDGRQVKDTRRPKIPTSNYFRK